MSKRKRGRPPFNPDDRRNFRLGLALSKEGREAILAAAEAAGLEPSKWVEAQAFKKDDGK